MYLFRSSSFLLTFAKKKKGGDKFYPDTLGLSVSTRRYHFFKFKIMQTNVHSHMYHGRGAKY